jgi:hypothetical protein
MGRRKDSEATLRRARGKGWERNTGIVNNNPVLKKLEPQAEKNYQRKLDLWTSRLHHSSHWTSLEAQANHGQNDPVNAKTDAKADAYADRGSFQNHSRSTSTPTHFNGLPPFSISKFPASFSLPLPRCYK